MGLQSREFGFQLSDLPDVFRVVVFVFHFTGITVVIIKFPFVTPVGFEGPVGRVERVVNELIPFIYHAVVWRDTMIKVGFSGISTAGISSSEIPTTELPKFPG